MELPVALALALHPRRTIRHILDTDPKRWVLVLALLWGFSSALSTMLYMWIWTPQQLALTAPVRFHVTGLLSGTLIGGVHLYITSALFTWIGRWLGGAGSFLHVRAAVGWSNLLFILATWLEICAFLVSGPLFSLAVALMLIAFVLFVWAIGVEIILLAEAHSFSLYKSLATALLSLLAGIICILLVSLVWATLLHPLFKGKT